MALTFKQAAFVREYLIDFNGKQAAIRAGYAENSAEVTASKLLSNPKVAAQVAENAKKHADKLDITAEYVLSTIRHTIERCAQAEPVLDRDGEPTGEYKFDASAVLKGSELLGKYLKLFTEKTELSNPDGSLRPPAPVYTVVKK